MERIKNIIIDLKNIIREMKIVNNHFPKDSFYYTRLNRIVEELESIKENNIKNDKKRN